MKDLAQRAMDNILKDATKNKPETFFFAQYDSCHWYMIPTEKRELWDELSQLDLYEGDNYDKWCDSYLEDYRLYGSIGDIEFIPINK